MKSSTTVLRDVSIKRIKGIGFGLRDFENYRIRALLYGGEPKWRGLGSLVVQ